MGIENSNAGSQEDLFYMTGHYSDPIPPMAPDELDQTVNAALLRVRGHVVGALDILDGHAAMLEEERSELSVEAITRHHRLLLEGANLANLGVESTKFGRNTGKQEEADQATFNLMLDHFTPLIHQLHKDRALARHPSHEFIANKLGLVESTISRVFSGIHVSEDAALGVAEVLLERQARRGLISAVDVPPSLLQYKKLFSEHTALTEAFFSERLGQHEIWDDLPAPIENLGDLAPEVSIVNRIVRNGLGRMRARMRRVEYIESPFVAAAVRRRIRRLRDYHDLARLAFDVIDGDGEAIEVAMSPNFRTHNFIRDTAWRVHMSGVRHGEIAEATATPDEASVSKVLRGIRPMEPRFARGVIDLLAGKKKISSVGRQAFAGGLMVQYQEYRADLKNKQSSESADE